MIKALTGIIVLLCVVIGLLGYALYREKTQSSTPGISQAKPPSPIALAKSPPPMDEEARAKTLAVEKIKARLNDPESLQIKDTKVVVVRGPGQEAAKTLCGYFNAKNGFGGYAGFKPFIYILEHREATTSLRVPGALQLFTAAGPHQDFQRLCDADGATRSADDLNLMDPDLP